MDKHTEFTKGPWEFDHKSNSVMAANGTRIIAVQDDGTPHAQHRHNGYLIAAAPDLYTTLKLLYGRKAKIDERDPIWAEVDSVLRKAKP